MKLNLKRAAAIAVLAAPFGPALAETQLTYMMWGDPPEIAVWEQIVKNFEAAHPDISVKVEITDWDSYWNKLRVQTVGGSAPDVFAMDAPIYPDWQSRGVLLDLTPYIDANPAALDGVYEGPLSSYKLAEGTFGLPRDMQSIVLFYNKDMFDAAGLAYPNADWTLDDLAVAGEALTLDVDGDGSTDQWGIGTELWDMEPFWGPVVYAYGGKPISDDFSKTLVADGPAADAWTYMHALQSSGTIMSDEDLESYGYDGFQAGVAAMTFSGHWVVPGYNNVDFKWDIAPFPKGPAARATLVNSAGIVGSATTEHPDEVWEFISYVVSPEAQAELAKLGFAIPIVDSVVNGPAYLEQPGDIDQSIFTDALDYAHTKPSFRGYEEWSGIVGDLLAEVWLNEMSMEDALSEITTNADDVLAANQ